MGPVQKNQSTSMWTAAGAGGGKAGRSAEGRPPNSPCHGAEISPAQQNLPGSPDIVFPGTAPQFLFSVVSGIAMKAAVTTELLRPEWNSGWPILHRTTSEIDSI